MRQRRRALVLGDESARHPFLASLPPHVRKVAVESGRNLTSGSGWRQFLTAYCASFAAVIAFIA
jgi:hypothetical protein